MQPRSASQAVTTIHLYQQEGDGVPFHLGSRQWARTDREATSEEEDPTREDFWVVAIPEDERGSNPATYRLEVRSEGRVSTIKTDSLFPVLVMGGHMIIMGMTAQDIFAATLESALGQTQSCEGCQREAMQATVDAAVAINVADHGALADIANRVGQQAGFAAIPLGGNHGPNVQALLDRIMRVGNEALKQRGSGGGPVTPPNNMPA